MDQGIVWASPITVNWQRKLSLYNALLITSFRKTVCSTQTIIMTQQLSKYMDYYVFSMILGSLPLHLPHAKYSVGIHAVAIVFETAAGSTKFETLYDIQGIYVSGIYTF